jgi:hypothetical protein
MLREDSLSLPQIAADLGFASQGSERPFHGAAFFHHTITPPGLSP